MFCQQLLLALALSHPQPVLPTLDTDLRRKTLNGFGFADTQFNETQRKFVLRATLRAGKIAPALPGRAFRKQPGVLEIGMAFGDLGKQILTNGAYYFGNDMDVHHTLLAAEQFQKIEFLDSQYDVIVGRFPFRGAEQDPDMDYKLKSLAEAFEFVDIGMFSVAMYMNGPELIETFRWIFDQLPSKGRLYLTAISPHTELFPGWEEEYFKRHQYFLENKDREDYFPGWIPNVLSDDMAKFVPAGYSEKYPPFFHVLHPDVLIHYAEKVGFRFLPGQPRFLRRAHPERLRYRGPRTDVGELASMIVEKP